MKLDVNERVWTSNEDSLLGTATDKEVGKLVGRPYLAVAERRRSLDILPGGRTRKEWTLAEMLLLGTAADHDIALRLGRTEASVQEKRLNANVRAGNPAYRFWTDEEIKLLGTMPDHDLAGLIKRHPSTVLNKRLKLRIQYLKPRYRAWSEKEIRLLGKQSDEVVAKQLGRAVEAVRQKRVRLRLSNTFPSDAIGAKARFDCWAFVLTKKWQKSSEEGLSQSKQNAIADTLQDGSGTKGTITISTRHSGNWLEIRIADTGPGIPDKIRTRIFDPFFTTKGVGKGTGQGLAIAHSVVVDKHGGTITFETEIGRGTTFIILLPINESDGDKVNLER